MSMRMTKREKIAYVKKCVREEQMPYFSESDFEFYLEKNNYNLDKTIYEMLCVKAEDSKIQISGLSTEDTSGYFRRLASKYKPFNSGAL